MTENTHVPVLLNEVLDALNIQPDGTYIDATFGRGGHSSEILQRLGENGRLFVVDRDPEAIAAAATLFGSDARVTPVSSAFANLQARLAAHGVGSGDVHGVLFDLGVSSPQLDDASRGFSFMRDGPLDMRMDPENGISAAEWLETVTEKELIKVIRQLGEEKFARRIANAIVMRRETEPFATTADLAAVIGAARPIHEPGRNPATRSFQAIRMYINDELEQIEKVLPQSVDLLAPGGRLVVIAFHSLEDRIVKRYFRKLAKADPHPPDMPIRAAEIRPTVREIGRLVRPAETETKTNVRARSARLRCIEKTELAA